MQEVLQAPTDMDLSLKYKRVENWLYSITLKH